jgi:segregation and condensation protein A
LLEYQRYREAAAKLGDRALLGRDVFAAPGEEAPEEDESSPPYSVSIFDLVQAMAAVLKKLSDRTPRRIELRDIPVAQCIPRILAALEAGARVEFIALFDDLSDHPLVIATFLALLELIRRGEVRVWQEERSGPIFLGRSDRFGMPSQAPPQSGDSAATVAAESEEADD